MPSERPLQTIAKAEALFRRYGLICRGGFDFRAGERAPALPDGRAARSVLLVGNAGAAYWPKFQAWLKNQEPPPAEPLDTWSRMVLGEAAAALQAYAVSPSDRPYQPFQRWAMRAEGLRPSPLGILMHPTFGLWHAYRGALLFDRALGLEPPQPADHACDRCLDKPCIAACPVGAYDLERFDHGTCLGWVRGADGGLCRTGGCLDRNACPQGAHFRYPSMVQAFHMAAFSGV